MAELRSLFQRTAPASTRQARRRRKRSHKAAASTPPSRSAAAYRSLAASPTRKRRTTSCSFAAPTSVGSDSSRSGSSSGCVSTCTTRSRAGSANESDPQALSRLRPDHRPGVETLCGRQRADDRRRSETRKTSGRATAGWNRLRVAAIRRDGFACRRCGTAGTSGTLTVHLRPGLNGNHRAATLDDLTTLADAATEASTRPAHSQPRPSGMNGRSGCRPSADAQGGRGGAFKGRS